MTNVHVIKAIDVKTEPAIASMAARIEDLLNRIRAGEITAVAFAATDEEGRRITNWGSKGGLYSNALVGSVHQLAHEMHEATS